VILVHVQSTMSRARTVKKKRKSSICNSSRLSLIKNDADSLFAGASVSVGRVSTVHEEGDGDEDDEGGGAIVPAIHTIGDKCAEK
jgi:hypothetical protein